MLTTTPEAPHGGLGEHHESKQRASLPISAISGTTVIPWLKLNVHVAVPKAQHPHKAHNQDKR
jgi:hypothetical protein